MKRVFKHSLSLLLTLALLFGMAMIPASAAPEVAEGYLYVREDFIDDYGFSRAVQDVLDDAKRVATEDLPYTVVVPKGTYDMRYGLKIYSNTILDLRGVTMVREGVGAGNMLRVGAEDSISSGVTGYAYENIRIIGGTFDGNMGENTIIKAFHTKNFVMDGVTVINEKEGHMMEFAGVDGLTIRNCEFKDQYLTPGNYGYEAIQLDVLQDFHVTNARSEDLPNTNVLIENCSFDNMPRAIGSHTAVHNRPHDNIVIRNNSFTNMGSIAVQGLNWTNVDIHSNYINNSPRGITVYAEPGGCTYLPSTLAKEGGTSTHASDSYQTPGKANIKIYYNVLNNIGTKDDIYASYSSQGIAVLGEKLTAKSPVESSDKSGGLPAGDYYLDGVSIHDNIIDVRGNGIRLEDVRNASVTDNAIYCSKNTVHTNDNYYGIVARGNASCSTVSYNVIVNAEVNGIQLDGSNGGSVTNVRFNRIVGTGKYGIGIYDMNIDKIDDNDISSTKNIGLFMDGSKANNIRWNRIRNCSQEGIWITSTSTASTIKSNTTVGCSGDNSFGRNTVESHYSSASALTDFFIPWDTKSYSGAKMGVGTIFHIAPDVRPTNAIASFTYTSSNENAVMVDAYGMVYAIAEGQATISVRSNNGITKKYVVTVEGDTGKVTHLSSPPAAPVLILGDADGNGAVESIDATIIQRAINYMEVPVSDYTLSHGDVDRNSLLELTDVTYIQRYLAGFNVPYSIGSKIS